MIPKFKVIDVTTEPDGRFSIKTIIIDDDKFVGYIFTFKDITLKPDINGVNVFYCLEIDFNKGHTPSVIDNEDTEYFMDVGHQIIYKIMTDLVSSVNASIDESTIV